MGGTVQLGNVNLNATRAQAVLNATPGDGGNVTFGGNNALLNLAQQVISAELNVARGSTVSSSQLAAIAAANAGMTVTFPSGGIQIATALSSTTIGTLTSTIENFNSAYDCH